MVVHHRPPRVYNKWHLKVIVATNQAYAAKRMPQVVEFDIDFSYDDEIKINVENLKKRVLFLKSSRVCQNIRTFTNNMSIIRK